MAYDVTGQASPHASVHRKRHHAGGECASEDEHSVVSPHSVAKRQCADKDVDRFFSTQDGDDLVLDGAFFASSVRHRHILSATPTCDCRDTVSRRGPKHVSAERGLHWMLHCDKCDRRLPCVSMLTQLVESPDFIMQFGMTDRRLRDLGRVLLDSIRDIPDVWQFVKGSYPTKQQNYVNGGAKVVERRHDLLYMVLDSVLSSHASFPTPRAKSQLGSRSV